MGEVVRDGLNFAVSSPCDSRASEARICIVAIKDKNGVYIILLGLSLYIMSSCLRRYSVFT